MATAKIERELAAQGLGSLGKAADDEPVFILRAQDVFAPALIEAWANHLIPHRANNPGTRQKITDARALAESMRAWQDTHGKKVPD